VHEESSGTVTFVFTDLEGSTRLWEEFPDAMREALARHDELLRSAITQHQGTVVKMTGDGVHAVFSSASDALAAAAEAQRAISAERWDATGPLRIRIGVHSGEAELRDADYYGPAVNRAARLMAAARGGQILVSLATEELARDRLDDGLQFIDLGEHRLRDLARPERVFQVAGAGLPDDIGPPVWLDGEAGNLPARVTSFVGREDAVLTIAEALRESPLVTITGTGGVGKTRLAVQTAARVAPEYPDGTWLCELGAALDDDEAIQIVANALAVTQRPGMSLEASLLEYLHGKRLLLLLDNCEHLLDTAGRLADGVIRECPGVRLLATSREGLAVDGEQIRPLRSLSIPDPTDAVDAIAETASATLFVDRARAVRPEFVLDAANAAEVAEICRRLDGIPLAIELAAARTVSMNPTEIASLVNERFRLLTGGRRTAVERHQTLRAAVDWSYALLTQSEQEVFARLSVFTGTFDADAALAVVAGQGIDRFDAIDAVGSLVAKSMLQTEEARDGSTRYRMLETMRQYGRDRLDDTGNPDRWRRRHAEHYAELAEEIGQGLLGPQELAWRARILDELDNVRSAVAWALDAFDADERQLGIRIIAGLSSEANSGRSTSVAAWAERALNMVDTASRENRAAVLVAAAWNALLTGQFDLACTRARAVIDEGVRGWTQAQGYVLLAYARTIQGRYDDTRSALAEGLAALDREPPDAPDHLMSRALLLLASVGFDVTNSTDAPDDIRARAAEALQVARESGHTTAIANALFVNALVRWRTDLVAAAPMLDESIAFARAGANSLILPLMLAIRALISAGDGDPSSAYAAFRDALVCTYDKGDFPALVTVLDYGIQTWEACGDHELAATFGGPITGELGPVSSLPVYEVPFRGAALERSRAALGEAAFDTAAARGVAMSFDELVALARTELEARIS
jgi:predicted ATPase/class 3 adenylate cyclase